MTPEPLQAPVQGSCVCVMALHLLFASVLITPHNYYHSLGSYLMAFVTCMDLCEAARFSCWPSLYLSSK